MEIKAYPLSDHAVSLQPASQERAWIQENETVYTHLPSHSVNGQGWNLVCPVAFTATWNGGPLAADIEIQLETTATDQPGFVQSQLGGGILTFHPGYQIKTEAGYHVWVRGPINAPKDGLFPLESMVDTSVLPSTIVMQWKFTRPNQPVHFAAGEPFAVLLPYAQNLIDNVAAEVVAIEADAETYEQEFAQLLEDEAIQQLFQRLGVKAETPSIGTKYPAGDRAITRSRWAIQLTNPPPVSCICPTYGRVALLEEAIYSFLQQDYPGVKELIVLNDYDGQTLNFDHPEVQIINLPGRFHSVGEKYKAAAALAAHDLIFVWHDDDIYLPHRLSYTVAHFDSRQGFFKADSAYYWNNGQLSGPERNLFHGGSCWSRERFVEVRGYPHQDNGYDVEFEQLCEDKHPGATTGHALKLDELYYIYRWAGTDSYHLSVAGDRGQERAAVVAYVQGQATKGQIPQGIIQLNPHWKTDYQELVQAYRHNDQPKPTEEPEAPFPPPFYTIPAPEPLAEEAAERLFTGEYPLRISVILPAVNESVLLKRTVEQFAATLPANSEIIVVDNGSIDGCADFLADPAWAGVQLIRTEEPLGVAGARNRGLSQARGEVIVFSDAHMDLPLHWWQPLVETLNRPNVGVVGPGIGVMGKTDSNIAYGQRIAEANLRQEWLLWRQKEPYPVPVLGGGFMAMRHATLKCAGGFDEGMPQWGAEDLELCVRYWLLGLEVWVAPAVTVRHYFRKKHSVRITPSIITHNTLRVALLHFNQTRLARVITELKKKEGFDQALARAVESNVWQQRAALASRRVRDDDWLFNHFQDSCAL